MKLTRSNIVLLVCAIITFGGALWYFLFFNADTGGALSATSETTQATEAEASFVSLAGQLDSVTFDTTFFQDPRFGNLNDIHQPISPEPGGRKDPFGAIPGVASE